MTHFSTSQKNRLYIILGSICLGWSLFDLHPIGVGKLLKNTQFSGIFNEHIFLLKISTLYKTEETLF